MVNPCGQRRPLFRSAHVLSRGATNFSSSDPTGNMKKVGSKVIQSHPKQAYSEIKHQCYSVVSAYIIGLTVQINLTYIRWLCWSQETTVRSEE